MKSDSGCGLLEHLISLQDQKNALQKALQLWQRKEKEKKRGPHKNSWRVKAVFAWWAGNQRSVSQRLRSATLFDISVGWEGLAHVQNSFWKVKISLSFPRNCNFHVEFCMMDLLGFNSPWKESGTENMAILESLKGISLKITSKIMYSVIKRVSRIYMRTELSHSAESEL